ncbi:hypothetical protein XPA_003060 [Xanthoria parietina]
MDGTSGSIPESTDMDRKYSCDVPDALIPAIVDPIPPSLTRSPSFPSSRLAKSIQQIWLSGSHQTRHNTKRRSTSKPTNPNYCRMSLSTARMASLKERIE